MSAEFIGQISKQRLGLPRNLKFSLSQCELGSSTLTRSNIILLHIWGMSSEDQLGSSPAPAASSTISAPL